MSGAFQPNAFQTNAFQENILTSTANMPLPVNCIMIGEQVYKPETLPLSRLLYRSIFRE